MCITKLLQSNFAYLIFDAFTDLLIYEQTEFVAKLVSTIADRAREKKTKAIFYTLNITGQEELIKGTQIFVDKVIDLRDQAL